MTNKNTIWLASYPKSGNTWFRIYLSNLLNKSQDPANINDLLDTSISSSRKLFDDYTGLSSSDLTHDEIDKLRSAVYRMQSQESEELLFKKVHDKFYFTEPGKPLFPPDISKGAIYIIRNPFDVLVSFAYHSTKPISNMINSLNDKHFAFCNNNNKLTNQLRQIMGSWSDHVKSWTEQNIIPVHIIRYEDMVLKPYDTFKSATDFIGINKTESEIKKAIINSDFKILTQQENKGGFKEKALKTKSFFRKGIIGDWKNHLDQPSIETIISNHNEIMIKFGYLNNKNQPIF